MSLNLSEQIKSQLQLFLSACSTYGEACVDTWYAGSAGRRVKCGSSHHCE